eukprot:CCRYP_020448-RB/>CCRYP_020448-RB protein AED:0.48 eAED:1.00 QI:0/-1/0/1/-1/0/1/0/10
MHGSIKPDET